MSFDQQRLNCSHGQAGASASVEATLALAKGSGRTGRGTQAICSRQIVQPQHKSLRPSERAAQVLSLPITLALLLTVQPFVRGETPEKFGEPTTNRWELADGGKGITWDIAHDHRLPHEDHVEMSGLRVSVVARHGVDADGHLVLQRILVWPMLRTIPNDTHASLIREFSSADSPRISVDGVEVRPQPVQSTFDGLLTYNCRAGDLLAVRRTLFPSTDQPAVIERWMVRNSSDKAVEVELAFPGHVETTDPTNGVYGAYVVEVRLDGPTKCRLSPGEGFSLALVSSARKAGEPTLTLDAAAEEHKRRDKVAQLRERLRLTTPDPVLNEMFQLSKIRAAESIFATKRGLMHGPGGTRYYAAIWANDQAEYANPYFAYLGDSNAIESATNCFRLFASYMNLGFRPIPSSIVAEGDGIWNGVGDRGDMAMIAYGAARFALTRGDPKLADQLLPLTEWCLAYLQRRQTPKGVIFSDSDELEGRLPAGKANLNTACLTYDALNSTAMLLRSLKQSQAVAEEYRKRAAALRSAINDFFGAKIEGFETYRYYDGNDQLRAWIATPLCMGIFDRKAGTIAALTSSKLWLPDGVASVSGEDVFWDRATLYSLRGAFAAGETERALAFLQHYSRRRLLGDHVPYAVEAWPEGNQRHLSAESALYGRIFVEGLLGYRPIGLRGFQLTPHLPAAWNNVALENVHAHGHVFAIEVSRIDARHEQVRVRLAGGGTDIIENIEEGKAVDIELPEMRGRDL